MRVVALAAADLVRRVARPGEVALEHVHVAVARVPDRREGVWRPAVELHQDEAHREAVAHDDQRVGALAAGAQVDAAHPPLPPRAEPAVHVGAALARREAVEEAADAHLLGAGRSELVALQVAKLLLAHARLDVRVDEVGLDGGAQAASRLPHVARPTQRQRMAARRQERTGEVGEWRGAVRAALRCGATVADALAMLVGGSLAPARRHSAPARRHSPAASARTARPPGARGRSPAPSSGGDRRPAPARCRGE